MSRWPEWFRRVGQGPVNPRALDVGKKLLGYLAIRRQTPGVQTLAQRVELEDGTIVEASFYGDQPLVRVYGGPGGAVACELYVESGMLDLGPNIAADADKRFNRGPPEFDDSPATLYFGDGVDCPDGKQGLNGKIQVSTAGAFRSECLPKNGNPIESRLRDPAKKKAQAMFPASSWSGLMHRYIQAIYGGDVVKYKATGGRLNIEGVDVGGDNNFAGLIELNGALYFIFPGETFRAMPVKFKAACAAIVYEAHKKTRAKGNVELADKLLTFAMSAMVPDYQKLVNIGDFKPLASLTHYGVQFSRTRPEAYYVKQDAASLGYITNIYTFHFAMTDDGEIGFTASKSEDYLLPSGSFRAHVSDAILGGGGFGFTVPYDGEVRLNDDGATFLVSERLLRPGEKQEYPIAAYYDDQDRACVVWFRLDAMASAPDDDFEPRCTGRVMNVPGADIGCVVGIGSDPLLDALSMRWTVSSGKPIWNMASGFYARASDGTVHWSTIKKHKCFRHPIRRYDEAAIVIEYVVSTCARLKAGMYFSENAGTFTCKKVFVYPSGHTTYEPENCYYEELGISIEPPTDDWDVDGSVREISVEPGFCGELKTSECGYPNCKTKCKQPKNQYDASGVGMMGYYYDGGCSSKISGGSSTPHSIVETTTTRTATVKATKGWYEQGKSDVSIGLRHALMIPHGDCRAFITFTSDMEGRNGNTEFGMLNKNYKSSKMVVVGEPSIVGKVERKCDGAGDHSEHTEVSEYETGTSDNVNVSGNINNNGTWPWDACDLYNLRIKTDAAGHSQYSVSQSIAGGAHGMNNAYHIWMEDTGWWLEERFTKTDYYFPLPEEMKDKCASMYDLLKDTDFSEPTMIVEDDDGGSFAFEDQFIETRFTPNMKWQNLGFAFTFARGLIPGAEVTREQLFAFGDSVNSDRHSFHGGYPHASTPSFVGWA